MEGVRNPNGCAPKMAQINFSSANFTFPTMKPGSCGGGGGGPPSLYGCQPFWYIPGVGMTGCTRGYGYVGPDQWQGCAPPHPTPPHPRRGNRCLGHPEASFWAGLCDERVGACMESTPSAVRISADIRCSACPGSLHAQSAARARVRIRLEPVVLCLT